MTHSHDHDHDHEHSHSHSHGHSHDHEHGDSHHSHGGGGMPFEQKLARILDHWIKHNMEHADTYKEWAERTRQAGMPEAAGQLEEAASMNFAMNEVFEKAKTLAGKGE
ncbi:MAG: hypothetical protein R6X08_13625 [Desulfosalsimonadaceae bacterium]